MKHTAKNNLEAVLGIVVYCKVLCKQTEFRYQLITSFFATFFFSPGKPVMIVIEYMENGSLDAFLRVSITFEAPEAQSSILF